MLRYLLVLVFSFFLVEALGQEFRFVKKENGISLYERTVLHHGKKTRELKTEFIVKASYQAVRTMIIRPSNAKKWSQHVTKYEVFDLHPNSWNIYIRYGLTWPLNDQDCVIAYEVVKEVGNYHELVFESTENARYPIFKNVSRIQEIYGRWMITEQEGYCSISYTVLSSKKTNFPQYITDPIIRNNVLKSFSKFKQLLGG